MPSYIAIDLGAESGRVIMGTLGDELRLEEVHRFANVPVRLGGMLRWNLLGQWAEIEKGIAQCSGQAIAGIGADAWGVDYVLVGKGSPMLAPAVCYRDGRTAEPYRRLLGTIGKPAIFESTGTQFMPINTLYHLAAEPRELLATAEAIVPIADWVNWMLAGASGEPRVEMSAASTMQLLDAGRRDWAWGLIERAGLPRHVFGKLIDSGTVVGQRPGEHGDVPVIATCSHDTGCAVAAVPAEEGGGWAYLSSGTWSLVGVEIEKPIMTPRCLELGFTNELGIAGTTRLLKNVSGLYPLQQCRPAWKATGREYDYETLGRMAAEAEPLRSLIRPEAQMFLTPTEDMPGRIAAYCRQTGQKPPGEPGQFARCIYESLALLYRQTLMQLRELTGNPIDRLHIVGGGGQAKLLNQLTADACALPVIAGPTEATAAGNVLIQAMALGHIERGDIRRIMRKSTELRTFNPSGDGRLIEAGGRFAGLPLEV